MARSTSVIGAIALLSIVSSAGFIMNDDLEYSESLPAPGALALLALFGVSAGRRRR